MIEGRIEAAEVDEPEAEAGVARSMEKSLAEAEWRGGAWRRTGY